MKQSLAELHAAHPYNPDEKYWSGKVSLEEASAMASELHLQDDPVEYLDAVLMNDRRKAGEIRNSLLFLPPKVLVNEVGVDIAAWTSVNTVIMGMNDEVNKELEDQAGYNIDHLEIARSWEWQQNLRILGKPVLAQYDLMQDMQNSTLLDQVDLPELLHTSAKPGVELSASRISDYELIPLEAAPFSTSAYSGGRVKDWYGDKSDTLAYHIWLDAPTGFALTYKGIPNAIGGIAMRGMNELMMYQLQGVQGKKVDPTKPKYAKDRYVGVVKSRGIAPLDWQKLMTGVTEQIASTLQLKNTGIQSGKNNIWTKKRDSRDTEPHLPIEAAERIYDAAAIRLGYTKRAEDQRGNWHKSVTH